MGKEDRKAQGLKPTEPLPLHHSWPLFDRDCRFDLGVAFMPLASPAVISPVELERVAAHSGHKLGRWECDLSDNSLTWSDEIYDIFGLRRGVPVQRAEAVALYSADSRPIMERLRAYAIRHRRGFTLDVEIRPMSAEKRRVRLIAAPVVEEKRVVRLQGVKLCL